MSAPVLEAKGLVKTFGALVAAKNINVSVNANARLSLIGANGAGKTTFVNMVTGYLKPDAGEVLLDGKAITGLPPRRITRAGVCRSFQIPQLCESMTALDNIIVAIEVAKDERPSFIRPAHEPRAVERAREVLERFGLAPYADQSVNELPGGVRKLIDIAMALASRPRVLLLDEPTSGVSSEEKFPLMDRVMAALAGENAAVIFVEHDMDIVTRYAERVLAFYSGEIIADDAPDEVLADPAVREYVTGTAR
ncbi:ABC transporter ATP-binding protein [Pikeienuella sp. HZG-20]|uniref:ABC transporter ATP-binding protein n=1 Tax=Paludibacillus litoralis TaxID=3133267 RepID=UPI0030ED7C71